MATIIKNATEYANLLNGTQYLCQLSERWYGNEITAVKGDEHEIESLFSACMGWGEEQNHIMADELLLFLIAAGLATPGKATLIQLLFDDIGKWYC